MTNIVSICIVCITLLLSFYMGIFTLFRGQGSKRNYFLLLQAMIIIYLLGYLLEITSTNADEAYTAKKILYLGVYSTPVLTFFFLADYCNVKIHLFFVKIPMIILSLVIILIMWTTEFHHLVYKDYDFRQGFINHLIFTPGILYSVIKIYPAVCMILTINVLVKQLKKWKNIYRKHLIILLICMVIPFIAEVVYSVTTMTGLNPYGFYFTPHSMVFMSFFLYVGIMRYNIFDIVAVTAASAMEYISEGFILVDLDNNFLSSNQAAEKILGGVAKLGKGESILSASGWPRELMNLEDGFIEFSIADRELRHYKVSISPVFSKNESLIAKLLLFREITDTVNLMKELENAAYIDSLTGLYNRKHFTELANIDIERALRTGKSIYAAMLDLDLFKNVNDTHGHAAGDMVLKATAGIVRHTIRTYDLLGRYGGEEFVLLITDLDPIKAYKQMERIRENMEHSITNYEDIKIKITCSIGLAQFEEGDTLETVVKKADDALYIAKNSGRNLVQIYDKHPKA